MGGGSRHEVGGDILAAGTNVIIDYLRGDSGVVSQPAKIAPAELAIPSIVVYELEYGTLRSKFPARGRSVLEEAQWYRVRSLSSFADHRLEILIRS
jgi:predicted nucleic acid-binding protein